MKKLIFCFDGTSNDPGDAGDFSNDSSISNVLKLHALFGGKLTPPNGKNDKTPGQRSFYYSGIGTYGGFFRKALNAMIAPPGADMEEILDSGKKDLDENFKDGDEIFIFGFSRGAAIARMFASKIGKESKRRVKFLGVFDTVAATKGSLDLRSGTFPASGIVFENGTMGEHIEAAAHLVSIDEKRIAFQPTLFNKDERVTEVWFAGVHSDIGGGYWFDGLADITLKFMCDKAKNAGLQILDMDNLDYAALAEEDEDEEDKICADDIVIKPLSHGVMHTQSRSGIAKKTLASRKVRVSVDDKESLNDLPIVHHTVCDRFIKVTGYRPHALRNVRYLVMGKEGNVNVKDKRTGVAELGDKPRRI